MSRVETAKTVLKQPGTKAMIAFVVVIVALVFALWPRGGDDPVASAPSSGAPTSGITDQTVSADELATARREAALAPCPVGGTPAPGAVLAGVVAPCAADGSRIDVGSATAGKPTVINMWAVWCLPCRQEMPHFDELSREAGDRLNVLAVHARDGAEKEYFVVKFLREIGVHLPVVTDPRGTVAQALGAPRVYPSTIMVRADGTVAAVLPRVFDTSDDLRAAVREHLGVDVGATA